ncbi:hypothetical protein FRC11_012437 [Ceratobasidium sp. 423]|nr:hypothetical protein FRC11_012437 [Ceratobasidium sp. 423]
MSRRAYAETRIQDARAELWDLVIFAKVALAVMAALHEDTLKSLDECYRGHRPIGYKPKSKWLGLVVDDSIPAVRARDLPRAGTPRALTLKTAAISTSTSGPILMARKTTDKSSGTSSTSSSGLKSTTYKRHRLDIPRPIAAPIASRPVHPRQFAPWSMQQGMASRRVC